MSREKDDLIVKQALDLDKTRTRVEEYEEVLEKILLKLVCIGGPLNDNKLRYSKEQRKIFHDIEEMILESRG